MKKKLLALFLCCALSFGLVTAALITPAAADEDFLVYGSDGLVAHTVELAKNNKLALTAVASTGSGVYQWQIQVGGDVWANISGANGVTLDVSYALVANLLYGGAANLRCRLTAGEVVKYTNTVTVQITDETPVSAPAQAPKAPTVISEASDAAPAPDAAPAADAAPAPDAAPANDLTANVAPAALADPAPVNDPAPSDNGEDEDDDKVLPATYTILIEYKFEDGKQAANPWSATVAAGSTYTQTITSPVVVGYTPDQAAVQVNASEGKTYTVTYHAAEVEFTVKHYQQNVTNDQYTLVDTETKKGFTESAVGDKLAKTYPGFSALLYDTTTKIAADGSTEVEVKYDRYYFLMKFNLNGGYGVEPIYARYGAPINVGEPKKAGYNFNHWAEIADGEKVTLPTVMPAESKTYFAVWNSAEGTKYTVEYFLQDADDPAKYDYIAFEEHYAATGSTVNGKDYKEIPTGISTIDQYERKYAIYNDEKTTGKETVAGDGSTILRVYYDRKDFTLKFYYAMSSGSGTDTTYYVIGGSTYRFGSQATISATGDEIKLLDHYMSDYTSQRGTVQSLPTLKTDKNGRYKTGYDTSTDTTYNYYYFTFSAKYGADLTDLWPVDVINNVNHLGTNGNWTSKVASVAGWNGEHHVYYSQHNENQTIKGKYSELDYQLLWEDRFGQPTDNTIAFLCFWENGASVHWNVPKLFRYNIWVPVLDNAPDGKETTEYNGVNYYLRDMYDTVDNSTPEEQTAPSVVGFTYKEWYYRDINDFDSQKYNDAYDMDFYYTRNQYELNFFGKDEATKKLYYEQPLKGEYYVPDYPANMEPGAYTFGGWYTSKSFAEGTYLNFDTAKMPAHSATLYPRWVSEKHTVKTYLTKEAMESNEAPLTTIDNVPHGTTVSAPTDPENGEYTFIGWFYMTETGEEQAFNFEMPVKRNLNLYAKWNSEKLLTYTVKYELEDGTEIAPPTTGSALAGTTKTFNAKSGTELNEGYQSGYFPKVGSHSITIDIEKPENNTFTFVYVQKAEVAYTVKYLEKGTEEQLAAPKTVTTSKAVITEPFKQIGGYAPDAYQKQLVLAAEGNEIIFWYIKDNEHAPVQIIHWTQNIAGEGYAEYQKSTNLNAEIGKPYSETPLTIPGFTYNETKSSASGELTAAGLVLNLYYDRIEYPYEFRFVEKDSSPEKTLADSVTGNARYQAQVTQTAKAIPGYTLVSAENQAINIAIEDPANVASKNVKTFYYEEQTVEIKYVVSGPEGCGTLDNYQESQLNVRTGTPGGSTPTASAGFKFVGWYKDVECKQAVDAAWIENNKITPQKTADLGNNVKGYEAATYYAKFEADVADLSITKQGYNEIDGKQSFIFTVTGPEGFSKKIVIQGNGTVVLKGLKIGDYTVTEDTAWSWRYTPDGGAVRTIPLQPGQTNSVTYVNKRTNNKWLDGNAYCKNVFGTVIETDSGN